MKTLEFKIRKAQVHSSEVEKKRLEKSQPSRVYVSEEALIELTGSKDGGRPITIEKAAAGEQQEQQEAPAEGRVLREATLWKAPQRLDKGVAQMYDTFCEACGYRLGDQVRITARAAGSSVPEAEEVVFEDLTAATSGQPLPEDDFTHWEFFLAGRLQMRTGPPQAEAIHIQPGLVLKDTVLDGPARSFRVLTVDQSTTSNAQYVHKKTAVKVQRCSAPLQAADASSKPLAVSGVCGLDAQVKEINRLLACFNRPSGRMPRGVAIHGGHGTGKTMLLEKLAQSGWGAVLRIHFTDKLSQIQETIQKALAQRPSLVLIDQLERLIDKDRPSRQSVIQTLCKAFDNLASEAESKGEAPKVAVVVTCLDYGLDVPEDLRRPGRLDSDVCLPTPDVDIRREILSSFKIRVKEATEGAFLQQLSERTHAYNGTDLRKLVNRARLNCETRVDEEMTAADGDGNVEYIEVPEDYEEAFKTVRPTAMHDVNLKPPPIRWHDIGGQHSVKETLHRAAVLFTMPKGTLHIYKNGPPKGVLLYGPPGCSKTMTAQAMATESGLNFFAVKGAELLNMYVGESERALRSLFKRARDAMPSIIFFDEIDSIAGARAGFGSGTASTSHGGLNVLTTLLNEMDGFENMEGVLVLAATNRPQALDPALLRPGRFDELVYVQPPDEAARRAIFEGVMAKRITAWEGIDAEALARQTEGFSGAEVKAVCEKAGDAAVQRYINAGQPAGWKHEVTMTDLEGAIGTQERQITPAMLDGYAKWAAQFRSR
ncbi:AAA-domain-containing protein [Thozetella sp. PMI_491]|nr:AAA-domain-containing protein [Thozetella sp. PMI_491]